MKKIIFLFCFSISVQIAFAQIQNIDSLLPKIISEKDNDIRFDMFADFFSYTAESDPFSDLKNAQKLLIQSQKNNDKIGEAFAFSKSGYNYRSLGNTEKSLEDNLKAVEIAQATGNEKLLVFTKMNLSYTYKDLANYPKTISLLMYVIENAEKIKYYKAQTWGYSGLAVAFLEMNKTDSALLYAQRCYELCMQKQYFDYFGYRLTNLGDVHGKLGNTSLAISYYDMAIQEGIRTKSPKQLNWVYTAKAKFFNTVNQKDSAILYAKKAVHVVQQTAFSNYSLKPAKLLLDIYKPINSDSALKYSEIYRIANDSLYSTRAIQQTQSMGFEDELRQQKFAEEKIKAEKQRKQNIQYALLGFGIISFLMLFLLLSRRIITNTKVIQFLGIVALLVIFEFLNLLLHPFLERVTHHNPVLMLLALVCIAAILIPLHHRLEKWATAKLVEKNKQIRLAAAKKTIEELEDEKNLNN